ncbi:MAG: bifunctional aspartate kinase/homoserine dehydrogenase I, partial [Candidatus Ornithospirochaeta sp.]|nr:bifunctional aspartate kinase/homoserine dehydrogenase I [Candidatus Ornithospirochaeta sp.]
IDIESLVPESLRNLDKEEFLDRLAEMDDHMLSLYNKAKAEGKSLRYVGKVENGTCSVSLAMYPLDHPFSQAEGTDNVIAFTTYRYNKQPLVIKGPGAGPEVTAAGVFSDILRLSAYLGSRI